MEQLPALEAVVASCYDTMCRVTAFVAEAVIISGNRRVNGYLPLVYESLLQLRELHNALIYAPSYSAYDWPNVALWAFGGSLVKLGVKMEHHPVGVSLGQMSSADLIKAGSELTRMGNALKGVSSNAFFYGGLAATALSKRLALLTSEAIICELLGIPSGHTNTDRSITPEAFAALFSSPAIVYRPR